MIKDLISIVMPTYNDAHYLSGAIEDILSQTYKNFELIIVDDGSTDDTQKIIKNYLKKDNRIRSFYKENGGTGSALNFGFKNANGQYGTWISSDDNKNKDFLERLVTFLQKNPDIEYVNSAFYSAFLGNILKPYRWFINEQGKEICAVHLDGLSHNQGEQDLTNKSYIVDNWCHVNSHQCFLGVCFMFTMRLKNQVGDYLEIPGEDYEMLMRMGINSRVGYIDSVLGRHNNPPDSLSMQNRSCVAEANRITQELYKSTKFWNNHNIPKVASFYWGSDKMSFMRYMTIKSFKKFNPSWSIHLYIPNNISNKVTWRDKGADNLHRCDQRDYKNTEDYFSKLLNEVPLKLTKVNFSKTFISESASEPHKSDLLGWKVLSSTGGLWVDMDIIFFKPVTEMDINPFTDTIVCYDQRHCDNDGDPVAPIGFMGSSGDNLFFKTVLKNSKNIFNSKEYQSIGCYAKKSAASNFKKTALLFNNNVFHNIEGHTVYGLDHTKISSIWEENKFNLIKDKGIGIHWYGGHPLSQKYNNLLTHDNWKDFDCTVCEAIKEVYNGE